MLKDIAIVTGGSSGLGFEIARQLLTENVNVIIVSRSKEKLRRASTLLKGYCTNSNLLSWSCNIGKENEVSKLFEFIKKQKFRPNLLFNCAGIGKFGSISRISGEALYEVLEGNLIGLVLMSTYALKSFKKHSRASIISILSTSALVGRANQSLYCAAKWGAKGFLESLRDATKSTNLSIINIFPGGIDTPFWKNHGKYLPQRKSLMKVNEVAEKIINVSKHSSSLKTSDLILRRLKEA